MRPASPHVGTAGDFAAFWTGQAISALGSAFTGFVLPLLVYRLTGSAVDLAITGAVSFLPWPLFGLWIGAWVDRVDRRILMIATDLGRAFLIASIPILARSNLLSIGWIYAVAFLSATLAVCFALAQTAAVPSLVAPDAIVAANGRIQASFAAAAVAGPALAGLLAAWIALPQLLYADALSFLVSAASLMLVHASFNAARTSHAEMPTVSLVYEVAEGLRYVLRHPVVRAIVVLAALTNFLVPTIRAELVLFANERFYADPTHLAWLYAAGPAGAFVFSLAASRMGRPFAVSRVVIGSTLLYGVAIVLLALLPWYGAALALMLVSSGLLTIFNITQGSLRQRIVPNELLGRVGSAVNVLAQSSAPLGMLAGGALIATTGNAALIYAGIGVGMILVGVGFSFSALGHAEPYLSPAEPVPERQIWPA